LATALLASLTLAHTAVARVRKDLLREETAMSVELLRGTADRSSLDLVFTDRWHVVDETIPLLDEAGVQSEPAGLVGMATVYDAESWNGVGTLYLRDREGAGSALPPIVMVLGGLALIGLALLSAWVVRPSTTTTFRRLLFPPLAVAISSVPLVVALAVTTASIEQASITRISRGSQVLSLIPNIDSLAALPGAVSQVTGASFVLRDSNGNVEFSTLPATTTSELNSADISGVEMVNADRVRYLATDVGRVRLAVLPYSQTANPVPKVVVVTLLGLLLATLAVALVGLVGSPRAFYRHVVAWSFLAPASIHLAIFTLGPLAIAAWLSLHRWSLLDVARPFVGLTNYMRVLGDGAFWNAIQNTVIFTLHVPVSMVIALALALIVQRKARGVVFLRAILFLPTITSLVAVAMVWQWMLHDQYGLFNWLLSIVGLGPVAWLSSPSTALLSIMIMATWMVVGYQMILFQAGLSAIPSDLYDAARIDGANTWRRFLHVTLPGLRHTLFFVLVTSVIGSFQVFGAVYVMTEGGPLHATDVAVFHIYEEAWEYFRFGDAAAMSWVLFAIIFVATWLQFRTLERRVEGRT